MKLLLIIVAAAVVIFLVSYLFPSRKRREEKEPPKSGKKVIFEYAEVFATALTLALIIRALAVQAFTIPSGSMIPTLLVGDYVLVNKFAYGPRIPFTDKRFFRLMDPERGDVVVFKFPMDHKRDFIKRVIGLPGDVIESKDKALYVNGRLVEEPYARHTDGFTISARSGRRDNFGPVVVPEDKYFVMGDNRDHSEDSRFWGFVDIGEIKGEAFIIYWSADVDKQPLLSVGDFKKFFPPRFGRIGDLITNPVPKDDRRSKSGKSVQNGGPGQPEIPARGQEARG